MQRLKELSSSLEKEKSLDNFDKIRIENNDKSILSSETFCSRFFKGNPESMVEAVKNYNHKIKRIEFLKKKIDLI